MDIRQIEYFLAIEKERNITQAAKKLNMAQPPLSRQLKLLEEELGVQLFLREKKSLSLTPEGALLKEQGNLILDLLRKTHEQIIDLNHNISGTLFIGSAGTVAVTILPDLISKFQKKYPLARYNIWSANSDDVMMKLERGLLDIAIVREPYDMEKFKGIRILQEPWIVVANKDTQVGKLLDKPIDLNCLANEDIVIPTRRKHEFCKWFKDAGITPNIICEYSPLMNALPLAEAGIGIVICPESGKTIINGLKTRCNQIKHPSKKSSLSLIWSDTRHLPNISRAFISLIEEIFSPSLYR